MNSTNPDKKKTIVGGFHPVDEIISKNGFLPGDELHVARGPGKRIQELLFKARKAGVLVYQDSSEKLTRILGDESHQGIVLVRTETLAIPELTEEDIREGGVFVVLESVQDPGNLGVIARSVAAFGASGLIMARHESAPLGQSAMKSSAGSLVHVRVMYTSRIGSFLQKWVDDPDVGIVGTSLEGKNMTPETAAEIKAQYKTVFLVFGAEQSGLSRLVSERCHYLFKIPQTDKVQSINVAQAATVFLYEFCGRSLV